MTSTSSNPLTAVTRRHERHEHRKPHHRLRAGAECAGRSQRQQVHQPSCRSHLPSQFRVSGPAAERQTLLEDRYWIVRGLPCGAVHSCKGESSGAVAAAQWCFTSGSSSSDKQWRPLHDCSNFDICDQPRCKAFDSVFAFSDLLVVIQAVC